MGYSYVYPPLKKGAEQSPASHGPPGSGSSQLNLPPQRPLPNSQDSFQSPPQSSRPAPQLTPDSFPGPQQDLDNFIPDFNPQEELQAFMQSIGDDFKDFNFGKSSRPARNNQVNQDIFLSLFFTLMIPASWLCTLTSYISVTASCWGLSTHFRRSETSTA